MVNDMELYLLSFIEGYLGPEKAYKLRNNAYKWRFKDAWRYGMMHRNAKKELEDGFSRSEVEAMDNEWELTVDAMTARIKELEAEVDLLRNGLVSAYAGFERQNARIAELEKSLKCECHKNELAKKYIETLIHPV